MNELNAEIEARSRAFAHEIADLVRKHALALLQQTLADAIGAKPAAATAGAAAPAARKPRAKKAAASSVPAAHVRRSTEELAKITEDLVAQITSRPGSRMETLRDALDVPTHLLAGPITKLLAAGRIRKDGEKRATRYYPA
ncbi:MAG: hypothetical protein IT379_10500 [Deltaproteobacteria bacterium]|nr:hypothetical protein [Deltaproteobacteria bacterium]